jgi:2-dehydro-3-deoxyglucarate aldolase/4-hydroxy-2-oxoheptanedioate aldolase
VPGYFYQPKFTAAMYTTIAATKKHKKALGRLVPTVELGVDLYAQGFDFVCYSGDVWVLHDALAAAISKLRSCCVKSQA